MRCSCGNTFTTRSTKGRTSTSSSATSAIPSTRASRSSSTPAAASSASSAATASAQARPPTELSRRARDADAAPTPGCGPLKLEALVRDHCRRDPTATPRPLSGRRPRSVRDGDGLGPRSRTTPRARSARRWRGRRQHGVDELHLLVERAAGVLARRAAAFAPAARRLGRSTAASCTVPTREPRPARAHAPGRRRRADGLHRRRPASRSSSSTACSPARCAGSRWPRDRGRRPADGASPALEVGVGEHDRELPPGARRRPGRRGAGRRWSTERRGRTAGRARRRTRSTSSCPSAGCAIALWPIPRSSALAELAPAPPPVPRPTWRDAVPVRGARARLRTAAGRRGVLGRRRPRPRAVRRRRPAARSAGPTPACARRPRARRPPGHPRAGGALAVRPRSSPVPVPAASPQPGRARSPRRSSGPARSLPGCSSDCTPGAARPPRRVRRRRGPPGRPRRARPTRARYRERRQAPQGARRRSSRATARYVAAQDDLDAAREMLAEAAGDDRELLRAEVDEAEADIERLEDELQVLLLPADPNDDKNVIVEIRGAEGGEEANLFARDLFQMYQGYAARMGWKLEVLGSDPSDLGGFNEVTFLLKGDGVWTRMKHEGGPHRVQRVPVTESAGPHPHVVGHRHRAARGRGGRRRHRPQRPADRRLPLVGPGWSVGEHHRLRGAHHPQADRARRGDAGREEPAPEPGQGHAGAAGPAAQARAGRAGGRAVGRARGRRSAAAGAREKIRTYNFKENRVTDHRIGLTLYKLDRCSRASSTRSSTRWSPTSGPASSPTAET